MLSEIRTGMYDYMYSFLSDVNSHPCSNSNGGFINRSSVKLQQVLPPDRPNLQHAQYMSWGWRISINNMIVNIQITTLGVNVLRPYETYRSQWTESSLVQVMAWRLLGPKPASERMLACFFFNQTHFDMSSVNCYCFTGPIVLIDKGFVNISMG